MISRRSRGAACPWISCGATTTRASARGPRGDPPSQNCGLPRPGPCPVPAPSPTRRCTYSPNAQPPAARGASRHRGRNPDGRRASLPTPSVFILVTQRGHVDSATARTVDERRELKVSGLPAARFKFCSQVRARLDRRIPVVAASTHIPGKPVSPAKTKPLRQLGPGPRFGTVGGGPSCPGQGPVLSRIDG